MNKLILLILVFGCALSLGAQEGYVAQTYYKNQSYSQLVQAIKENSNALNIFSENKEMPPKQQNLKKQNLLNISAVFVAQVLKKHPEYFAKCAQNFSNVSFYEKAIFLRGLRSAEMNHDLLNDISDKKLKELVNAPNLPIISHLQVRQGGDLDYLWASFFATGDDIYIRRIIEILNRDNELLIIAHEKLKRGPTGPVDDLYKRIERKGNPTEFFICLAALWSLDSLAAQDPTIDKTIQRIIKKDPSLNYFKKINRALGKDQ